MWICERCVKCTGCTPQLITLKDIPGLGHITPSVHASCYSFSKAIIHNTSVAISKPHFMGRVTPGLQSKLISKSTMPILKFPSAYLVQEVMKKLLSRSCHPPAASSLSAHSVIHPRPCRGAPMSHVLYF